MTFTTTIVTDPLFFTDSAAEINALVATSMNQPFFMQAEYLATWWKHEGGGELQIITVLNESQELVGFLPLFNNDKNIYRIVGAVDLSDYLDALVTKENAEEIFQEIATALKDLNSTEIKLESLGSNSSTLITGKHLFENAGFTVTQTQQDVCPVITLPKTWDEYLTSLDSDQQKKIKRLQRSIGEEDEITYRLLEKFEEIENAVASFITLHKASSSEKNTFWTPEREAFFQEIATQFATKGQLKLYFLDVNGDPAATFMIFDYQNQFLLYNSGFNAYRYGHMGVSNALLLHTIKEAIKMGKSRFDFMRGDEAYKFQFGAQAEPLFDLTLSQK